MEPGWRAHKGASLRVAIPEGLPVEMWEQMREIVGVSSQNQRRGEASALMHQTCAEADRSRLGLLVRPEPFSDGLTLDQLKRFYSKFGFVEIQAEPCLMARVLPQKPQFDGKRDDYDRNDFIEP